jgi:GDP-4-dehydro-6-deoxy-D-mannose reductase
LVTGCDGFVGRVLVGRLVDAGEEVWGVDRAPEGAVEFAGDRRVTVDLTDFDALARLLDESMPDRIVHLAAQSSVRTSFDEPIPTILNNTVPVFHLLNWLRAARKPARLLAIGSAEEYGVVPAERLPLAEDSAVNPSSPYALAKSIQNQACRTFATLYHTDVVVTRSFNHTGAGQTDTFVLPSFARQLAEIRAGRREPVLRVGNLDVKRDFLDVRDVCAAYEALLERGESGETYNVCSGRSHGLRGLLEKLCEIAGVEVRIEVDPNRLRPVEMRELRGDPSRIEAATGWKASIPIEETLASLIDYWDSRVEATNRRSE